MWSSMRKMKERLPSSLESVFILSKRYENINNHKKSDVH